MYNVESHEAITEVYIPCWNCNAGVPNGLVKQRTMPTGYLTGRRGGTYYEKVSLCGTCNHAIAEEEHKYRQIRGQILGAILFTIALTLTGMPLFISLLIACVLAWYQLTGIALVSLLIVCKLLEVKTLTPMQYVTNFIWPWVIVMVACWMVIGEVKRAWQKRPTNLLQWQRRAS